MQFGPLNDSKHFDRLCKDYAAFEGLKRLLIQLLCQVQLKIASGFDCQAVSFSEIFNVSELSKKLVYPD
jgi:hypothetical protein